MKRLLYWALGLFIVLGMSELGIGLHLAEKGVHHDISHCGQCQALMALSAVDSPPPPLAIGFDIVGFLTGESAGLFDIPLTVTLPPSRAPPSLPR